MTKDAKTATDFRYNTGAARVPWAAVGEDVLFDDIMAILRFLCKPKNGMEAEYEECMSDLGGQVEKLWRVAGPATKLSLGDKVSELERVGADYLGAEHCCFLTNATAGFEIAQQFAGVGPGDEVIIPAITFIATMAYPLHRGAKVVLADVDPRTLNMDPEDVARKITDKTKVIIPVHLGGYPVDMDPIMELAEKHDIIVLEDAAHAFGGEYKGRKLGAVGHFGSFSFHEVKNITSLGEGGLLVTNTEFGKDLGKARFCGLDLSQPIEHWLYDVIAVEGKHRPFAAGNHSSTEIQAVCLLNQIKRLDDIMEKRREAAEYLSGRFQNEPAIIPQLTGGNDIKPTYHLYLLQIDPEKAGGDIQTLRAKLKSRGVTEIPHFAPLYRFSILRQFGYDCDAIARGCPVAEEAFLHRFTHLPLYHLGGDQLEYMADTVIESIEEMKAGK
jgi:dTDP-4-amino-4,6-dideoxygalactose transaminase